MKSRRIILIVLLALLAIGAFTFAGCNDKKLYEGKTEVSYEFNGGILRTGTAGVQTGETKFYSIYYDPGSRIIRPEKLGGYSFEKNESDEAGKVHYYNFLGWFKDEKFSEEWDFKNDRVGEEKITLYAKWEKIPLRTYTVCYTDKEGEVKSLGYYSILNDDEGDKRKFSDFAKYANKIDGGTFLGTYYSDKELTVPWDNNYVLEGGDTDFDKPVYVDYIEGTWNIVRTFDDLKSATGANIYLMNNIDCKGEEFKFSDYTGHLNGRGYKISNFVVKGNKNLRMRLSLFQNVGANAIIENVTFDNVVYSTEVDTENYKFIEIRFGALAASLDEKATVTGVVINGTFREAPNTSYEMDTSKLKNVVYEGKLLNQDQCKVNITVENN